MGSTLTPERRYADLLIAFAGFLIAFFVIPEWRVIHFAFHRPYSTPLTQNSFYHQHQATLRNSSSPEDGVNLLLRLLWGNHH